jgi:hypothetical protein
MNSALDSRGVGVLDGGMTQCNKQFALTARRMFRYLPESCGIVSGCVGQSFLERHNERRVH